MTNNNEAIIFRAAFLASMEVVDHGATCQTCMSYVLTAQGDFCPEYHAFRSAIAAGLELLPTKTKDQIVERALRDMRSTGYDV